MNGRAVVQGLRTIFRSTTGLDLVRFAREKPAATHASYKSNLLYEADEFFNACYDEGIARSGTPYGEHGSKRHTRFYDLVQLFSQVVDLEGAIAECGCFRGLSSFVLCSYKRRATPAFRGEGYHIFDSFEGLSPSTAEDVINDPRVSNAAPGWLKPDHFAATIDVVRNTLADYPEISYHPGWIPDSFANQPERRYSFVHVDVDLGAPTRAATEYFYPRLVPGGMLVCDDYGHLRWPGAKQALDEYSREHNLRVLTLSTGQGVLWKPLAG